MLHKISSLAFLGLVATLLAAAPANADLIHEWDADAAPYHGHDVHVDVHPLHDFYSGVPNTAEWIWWLNHSDIKDSNKDPVTADVHVDVDKFSVFDHDHFEGANSDFIRPLHDFHPGVPNTAEWIWWLNHSDNKDFGKDPVSAPEPASLFLLGSGVLALGAWRRHAKHSAPIS